MRAETLAAIMLIFNTTSCDYIFEGQIAFQKTKNKK